MSNNIYLKIDEIVVKNISENNNLEIYAEMMKDTKVTNSLSKDHSKNDLNLLRLNIIKYKGALLGIYKIEDENTPFGTIGISNIDYRKLNFNIGISIHASYRSFGYAYKAIKGIINYFQIKTNFKLIWLCVNEDNIAAIQLYYKLGFMSQEISKEFLKKKMYNPKKEKFMIFSFKR